VPVPWNPSYVFRPKDCGSGLEVGDPVGHTQPGNAISITSPAMTYNLQNIALASWFMDAIPSFSVNGWYTMNGAIKGEFAAPAPDCPSIPTRVDKVTPDNGPLQGGTKVRLQLPAMHSVTSTLSISAALQPPTSPVTLARPHARWSLLPISLSPWR
jgi:hypothetical protein